MVRANNIFGKLAEVDGLAEEEIDRMPESVDWAILHGGTAGDELWELVALVQRLPTVAAEAVRNMELSVFAKFVYGIAQKFNSWYQKYPILREEDTDLKSGRTVFLQLFRGHYRRALSLMGIEAPRRM